LTFFQHFGRLPGERLVNWTSNAERMRPAAMAAAVLFLCLTVVAAAGQRSYERRAPLGYAQLQARQNVAQNQRQYQPQQRPNQPQQRPNQNQQRPYQPQQRPNQNQPRPVPAAARAVSATAAAEPESARHRIRHSRDLFSQPRNITAGNGRRLHIRLSEAAPALRRRTTRALPIPTQIVPATFIPAQRLPDI